MRRLSSAVILGISIIVRSQLASAADLSVKAPSYAPSAPPVYNWSGCYLGANVGGASLHSDFVTVVDPGSHFGLQSNVNALGVAGTGSDEHIVLIGGGQVGCNWQFAHNWVIGIEGDFNGLSSEAQVTGSANTTLGPATVTNSLQETWLATVRPRIGYAFDRSLIYVTGGVAFAGLKFKQTYNEPNWPAFGSSEVSKSDPGWTIGAGYEYALADNWSVKFEYLYAKFDTTIPNDWLMVTSTGTSNMFHGSTSSFDLNIVRVGMNYKF